MRILSIQFAGRSDPDPWEARKRAERQKRQNASIWWEKAIIDWWDERQNREKAHPPMGYQCRSVLVAQAVNIVSIQFGTHSDGCEHVHHCAECGNRWRCYNPKHMDSLDVLAWCDACARKSAAIESGQLSLAREAATVLISDSI